MSRALLRLLAFRYALGRTSYITQEMVDELIDNWDEMEPWHEQIRLDIINAIHMNRAGHDVDVEQWKRILEVGNV